MNGSKGERKRFEDAGLLGFFFLGCWFWRWRMGTTSQGEKWSLESGKGKEMHSLPEPSEGNQPANTSIVGSLTSRAVRWYKFVLFMPLRGSDGKESTCNSGDQGLIPGLRRSPGEGNDNPLQYSCLANPMNRVAWRARVHGIAESDTAEWLTIYFFTFKPLCGNMLPLQ